MSLNLINILCEVIIIDCTFGSIDFLFENMEPINVSVGLDKRSNPKYDTRLDGRDTRISPYYFDDNYQF